MTLSAINWTKRAINTEINSLFYKFFINWFRFRGTDSSGIVGTDGVLNNQFEIVKGKGLVREVYRAEEIAKFQSLFLVLIRSF